MGVVVVVVVVERLAKELRSVAVNKQIPVVVHIGIHIFTSPWAKIDQGTIELS